MLATVSISGTTVAVSADLLRTGGSIVKWESVDTDVTIVITYAVLDRPLVVSRSKRTLSPDNCGVMQPFTAIAEGSPGVGEGSSRRELRAAFSAWENVADVKFIEIEEPSIAQIVVGASESSAGRAFANLRLHGQRGLKQPDAKELGGTRDTLSEPGATTTRPSPVASIEQAFVCLNPKVPWKIGFDGNLSIYDLRYTFMHEIGHAIGLDHPGRSGAVMGFRYDETINGLQSSDIAAAQFLYGPAKLPTRSMP